MNPSPVVTLQNLTKHYRLYPSAFDRLKEALNPFNKHYYNDYYAADDISFELFSGDVLGIVGDNGAGKSTLLKMISGVLTPSSGTVNVRGRIASLLELGAGFNPEYTGIENIYFQGTLMGYTRRDISFKVAEIIEFADIGEFIHQSVKTYSSGMFARLAFAVATSVNPDILIVDEALSVGDGAFARKSFDRIMFLKENGCTIIFCSHTMYHIEMICTKALWLEHGKVRGYGKVCEIIKQYEKATLMKASRTSPIVDTQISQDVPIGCARIESYNIFIDDEALTLNKMKIAQSCESTLTIYANWISDPSLGIPNFAVTIHAADGRMIGSAGSHIDEVRLEQNHEGKGSVCISFPNLPLLKGEYEVELYLMCERGVMFYDQRIPAARFYVVQGEHNSEQGLVHLPRVWK